MKYRGRYENIGGKIYWITKKKGFFEKFKRNNWMIKCNEGIFFTGSKEDCYHWLDILMANKDFKVSEEIQRGLKLLQEKML